MEAIFSNVLPWCRYCERPILAQTDSSSTVSANHQYCVDTSTYNVSFYLFEYRSVVVGKKSLIIRDEYWSKKFVILSPQRPAGLKDCPVDIKAAVEDLINKETEVDLKRHIGAHWFMCVKTGVQCVDIRKHFKVLETGKIRPTRTGIGLRIREWRLINEMKDAISKVFVQTLQTSICITFELASALYVYPLAFIISILHWVFNWRFKTSCWNLVP